MVVFSSGSATVGSLVVGSLDSSDYVHNAGNFSITSGAQLTATDGVYIGDHYSYGKVVVDGAGSRLTAPVELWIGRIADGGSGTLIVQNGGTMSSASALIWSDRADFSQYGMGADQVLSSKVVVTGSGSTWINAGALALGGGSYGKNSSSMLIVSDGGSVSTESLSINGPAAVVLDGGSLSVGAFTWSGQFLNLGGSFGTDYSALDTYINPTFVFQSGTLTVDGSFNWQTLEPATLSGTSASAKANLVLNNVGLATVPAGMNLYYSSVTVTGNTTLETRRFEGNSSVGGVTIGYPSQLSVSGAGALWKSGFITAHQPSTFDITNGGQIQSTDVELKGFSINVTGSGSTWAVTGYMGIQDNGSPSALNISAGGAVAVGEWFSADNTQINVNVPPLTLI